MARIGSPSLQQGQERIRSKNVIGLYRGKKFDHWKKITRGVTLDSGISRIAGVPPPPATSNFSHFPIQKIAPPWQAPDISPKLLFRFVYPSLSLLIVQICYTLLQWCFSAICSREEQAPLSPTEILLLSKELPDQKNVIGSYMQEDFKLLKLTTRRTWGTLDRRS